MMLFVRAFLRAVFLDIPFLIDSAWRRLDFNVNCEFRYQPASKQTAALVSRASWRRPIFWFFSLTVVFIAYGPVWDGLCTVFVPPASRWVLGAAAIVTLLFTLRLMVAAIRGLERRIAGRFGSLATVINDASINIRLAVARFALWTLMILVPALLGAAAIRIFNHAVGSLGPCEDAQFSWLSFARLLVCILAILAFGFALARVLSTRWLIWIQFILLVGVASAHWWALDANANEASGLPYRHIFALVAPALCFVLCLAPIVAHAKFKPWAGFKKGLY